MTPVLSVEDRAPKPWHPPLSWFHSRVFWREVARRLPDHPAVLAQAARQLSHLLETGTHACSRIYVLRWQALVQEGLEAVVAVFVAPDDDESQVLRSCAPAAFMALISEAERDQLRDRVKQEVMAHRSEGV